jgi:elongation factor P
VISTGDLKKGITLELNGALYQVVDFRHIKVGRGSAQVALKLRNIQDGHTVERTFQAGEKFAKAHLAHRTVQYLYNDGNLYYFMDMENFEQMPLNREQVGDAIRYLKEGATLAIVTHRNHPIGVELPNAVELEVVDTGPGFKGDTASAGSKPATLETGITISVPLFVSKGDVVKVDTRTGQYLERKG